MSDLASTAKALVAPGRGILAADESSGTIKKRFDSISVDSTEENRRQYREMLFTTPGMGEFISGVILYDETIRQSSSDGRTFVQVLEEAGVIPGIKVDTGSKPLAGFPGEQVTEGLDGLRDRLAEYVQLGAKFAKWRAVIDIDVSAGVPIDDGIAANAHALARYASLCQEAGLVPIVEPEVMMEGDHSIETCFDVTSRTLHKVYDELFHLRVDLPGSLLKPNMVLSGKKNPEQAGPDQVADTTIRCFLTHVPAAVPGIVFLSGGQTDEQATANLNAMNARAESLPWQLSFSYGRALQAPALKAWSGADENLADGQKAFYHRAKLNGAARHGQYTPDMESAA
jgi:fructose-bisphosphate aldolase class I